MTKILSMKDLFGKALLDYQNGNYSEDIITSTSISDEDELPLPYLFRSYSEMPRLEQKALDLAKGKILDIGCGAGSHSLYLQKKGFKVKAIDISKGAIEVCKKRGVLNTEVKNILDETEAFDTILLLMNGTGVFEDLETMPKYLRHLKKLMKPKAQTLIDSSDIKYMYDDDDDDDDGSYWMDTNANYYGELDYYVSYKGEDEEAFKMLYLDFETLKSACNSLGLQCELVIKGEHYDYLARITF